jgi:hypothetical protein
MEQHEYDALVRRMDTRIALLETFQEQQQRLMEKMDSRQEVHEDIMKSLAATLVKQDTINERLTGAIEHVTAAIERLDVTLQVIKDLLPRGNGREG